MAEDESVPRIIRRPGSTLFSPRETRSAEISNSSLDMERAESAGRVRVDDATVGMVCVSASGCASSDVGGEGDADGGAVICVRADSDGGLDCVSAS